MTVISNVIIIVILVKHYTMEVEEDETIKFTEKRLFQLFSEVVSLQKKRPSLEAYCAKIDSTLPSPCKVATHSNVEILRAIIRKYTGRKDKRLAIKTIIEQASTDVKFTVDIPSPPPPHSLHQLRFHHQICLHPPMFSAQSLKQQSFLYLIHYHPQVCTKTSC